MSTPEPSPQGPVSAIEKEWSGAHVPAAPPIVRPPLDEAPESIPTPAPPRAAPRHSGFEPIEASEQESRVLLGALWTAPPWMVSLVVHMLLVIFLGLLTLPSLFQEPLEIELSLDEEVNEEILDLNLDVTPLEDFKDIEPLLAEDFTVVNLSLPALTETDSAIEAFMASNAIEPPKIGLALSGRSSRMKKTLLAAYGGNQTTEDAVKLGLVWLKRKQFTDGSWSLKGRYADASSTENKTAATAMALLAFQGAGHTHISGEYKTVIRRGWGAMFKSFDAEGNFYRDGPRHEHLYSQAQATIALCELYGMTQDVELRPKAQLAIDYALKYQASQGGWRYTPGTDSDLSVTGWFVMALQSALMAGLDVPTPALEKISKYLDSVAKQGGSQYSYQPGRNASPAMTAEGLLCRQYLGWNRQDPRLLQGVKYLNDHPIVWDRGKNVYYWYYATQVTHHMEGEAWDRWNSVMRRVIPANQVKSGAEAGSWSPKGDRWGGRGGRLFETCLCIYMLEVYYRHLPIYSYRVK